MTMVFRIVTDGNGNNFHALADNNEPSEAWVFFNRESGFGNNAGEFKFVDRLKELPDGKLGR